MFSLIRRVIQLRSSDIVFFAISLVKCFQHRLSKLRKFQPELDCENYCLNFHQVQITNGIRCSILQNINGQYIKLSCKNVHAFTKICYFLSMVWAVGTGKCFKQQKRDISGFLGKFNNQNTVQRLPPSKGE